MFVKKRRRKEYRRLQAQNKKASVAQASFTLINTILGADLLILPYCMARTGWGACIILQIATAIIAAYSFITLSVESEIVRSIDYQFVVQKILGKVARIYCTFSLLVYLFFTMLGFCVALKDSMFLFKVDDTVHKNVVMWVVLCGLMIPLSLIRDLKKLSITSFLAILSVSYILIYMIAINIMIATKQVKIPQQFNSDIPLNRDILNFLSGFTTQTLFYTGHFNAINVYNELPKHSINQMKLTSIITAAFVFVINVGIGLAGYFIFTDSVSTNVLKSINMLNVEQFSIPTGVANVCMIIITISSYPLLCFCFRLTVKGVIYGEQKESGIVYHFAFTISTGILLGLIASFLKDLGCILNLASCIAGLPLVLVFPAFLRFRVAFLKRFEPQETFGAVQNDIEELINQNNDDQLTIEQLKKQIRENHTTQCFSITLGIIGIGVTLLGTILAIWDFVAPITL